MTHHLHRVHLDTNIPSESCASRTSVPEPCYTGFISYAEFVSVTAVTRDPRLRVTTKKNNRRFKFNVEP